MIRCTLFGTLILQGMLCQAQAAPCQPYDAPAATLRGTVVIKTFYGPLGYGETPKIDRRETQGLLQLDAPVCVFMEPNRGAPQDHSMVTLVPPGKVNLSHYRGKKVAAGASLFQAFSGHHHTDVLLTSSPP